MWPQEPGGKEALGRPQASDDDDDDDDEGDDQSDSSSKDDDDEDAHGTALEGYISFFYESINHHFMIFIISNIQAGSILLADTHANMFPFAHKDAKLYTISTSG